MVTHKSSNFFIGWDVGGWNCERNPNSRDALVILDAQRQLIGSPWRGNLRQHINEAETTTAFICRLFKLCGLEAEYCQDASVTLAIDTPLGFSKEFVALITGQGNTAFIDYSEANPYLYRYTERLLFSHGLKPLSAVKDMIGSQATKGMHVLAKYAPHQSALGVWSDMNKLTAIEAYPSACKRSEMMRELLMPLIAGVIDDDNPTFSIWDGVYYIGGIEHADERDALVCALIAWSYQHLSDQVLLPHEDVPSREGWIFIPKDCLNSSHLQLINDN